MQRRTHAIPPEDLGFVREVVAATRDLRTRVAGRHRLEDFRTAVEETLARPEAGKRLLVMGG